MVCIDETIHCTNMKFSIKGFFSEGDQFRRKLLIWSHLLKKSVMENFIFCAVLNWKVLNCYDNMKNFNERLMSNIGDYFLFDIVKNFLQLMLYFQSLRSPWRWAVIFRYSPSPRNMVAFPQLLH